MTGGGPGNGSPLHCTLHRRTKKNHMMILKKESHTNQIKSWQPQGPEEVQIVLKRISNDKLGEIEIQNVSS